MAKKAYPEDFDEKSIKEDFIIIKVKETTIKHRGSNYKATRGIWVLNPKRANKYPYVFSVVEQVVEEVYKVEKGSWAFEKNPKKWALPDNKDQEFKRNRYFFVGEALDDNDPIKKNVIGKRIPEKYRNGSSNPIQYSS